ncbi:nucleotidyltransferase domain-containing protein [Leifsonia aquatica]|uniref:nucleotidyltransferase domain-containing protein n=1 Tax=Leifsonia aquatica TaxID=144185 RepID=UPI0037FCBA35
MRAIPDDLDATIVSAIDDRLAGIERDHRVTIPWAIESGSRAWGFPSPDSDYDGRFLFVRPAADYLRLTPLRDVIETPLDAIYDVNGWDVRKALALLVGGNATVVEWLRSPIIYSGDAAFREGMLDLAAQVLDRERVLDHYLHVGIRHRDAQDGRLKRFFYALRPAAVLGWLRTHPGESIAPMDLPTLLAEADPPAGVVDAASALIARKAVTRELGAGEAPDVLVRYVDDELLRASEREQRPRTDRAAAERKADAFFLRLIALS